MTRIELIDVNMVYQTAGNPVVAIDQASLVLEPGEIVLLVGPSGSGKTSLLSVLGCILRPTSGQVWIGDVDAAQVNEVRLSELRARNFGYVFQHYNLFDALTARENVEAAQRMKFGSRKTVRDEASRLLDRVGLANRSEHKPRALSGGQCQRVAIARALIGNPAVILADEPTAALDTENALDVMRLFRGMAHDDGRIVVMVSHDHRLEKFADRVLRMEDGCLMSTRTDGSRPRILVPGPVATALSNAASEARLLPPGDRTSPETTDALRANDGQGASCSSAPHEPDLIEAGALPSRGVVKNAASDTKLAAAAPRAARTGRRLPRRASLMLLSVLVPCGLQLRLDSGEHRAAGSSEAQVAQPKHISRSVIALGKVEAGQGSMNLSITLPGMLAKVYVEEGQWFEKGQVLAELMNEDLIARVDIATHELTQAEARLELLTLGSRKEEIDEARAQVEGLSSQHAYLSSLKRMREQLFSRRAASKEEVLEFQSRADVNTKELEAAMARWERLKAGPRQQEIAGAEAAIRVARARLHEATITHERSRLKAPRAGCVLRLYRREGESVSGTDQTPVLVMADPRELAIRAEVDESQARLVREGLQASVSIPGHEGIAFGGTVRRISDTMGRKVIHSDDPLENVDSRVLEVIVSLPKPGSLRINQRVHVSIHTDSARADLARLTSPPKDVEANGILSILSRRFR
jgi:putative ABC transport system ATP-binding protein